MSAEVSYEITTRLAVGSKAAYETSSGYSNLDTSCPSAASQIRTVLSPDVRTNDPSRLNDAELIYLA